MLYVIIGEDYPQSLAKRLAARPAHLERLQALQAQGRLILKILQLIVMIQVRRVLQAVSLLLNLNH